MHSVNFEFEKLKERCKNKTLLGVGPVTREVTKIAIDLANEIDIPILLIPSRRQVECKELGGGYVFNTEDFSNFVKNKNIKENVILARDHGGPRQGTNEPKSYEESLEQAILSYENDIKFDFNILHLDPSLAFDKFEETLNSVQYLYNECEKLADKYQKNIVYEIGTDAHGTKITDPKEFEEVLKKAKQLKKVKFIVGNSGACVRETFNLNTINLNAMLRMSELCEANDLFFKAHNMDYLNYRTLKIVPRLGCHSINIAPSLGTEQSRLFLSALLSAQMYEEYDEFLNLCHKSNKWNKWMFSHSENDLTQLAIICGHYLMENDRIKEIITKLDSKFNYSDNLKIHLTGIIKYYLSALGWI